MESWENKIIADKIDSLKDLPAGYSPDLSSKWEIIEAGLPEKRKDIISILIRWSAAAAILVCIMLAGVKMGQQKNVETGLGTIATIPLLSINLQIEKNIDFAFVNNQLSEKVKPQKKVFIISEPSKKVVVRNEPLPPTSNEIKANVVDVQIDTATTISSNEIAATNPQPEIPKRTKRKTFQKDFNDGKLVLDKAYSKPASQQFSFKLQLHPSTGDDAQPSPRLQLKQVL